MNPIYDVWTIFRKHSSENRVVASFEHKSSSLKAKSSEGGERNGTVNAELEVVVAGRGVDEEQLARAGAGREPMAVGHVHDVRAPARVPLLVREWLAYEYSSVQFSTVQRVQDSIVQHGSNVSHERLIEA